MLPTKLTRAAAQRATASSPPTATCYACLAKQRTHQRRHSSSKASSSADRYSNKSAGPAAKAAAAPSPSTAEGEPSATPPSTSTEGARTPQRSSKGRTRLPRRTASGNDAAKKVINAEPEEQFTKLPSVPSVQSLSESDRSLSNFFSLHRPMSITHTFPPPSSAESFSKIFTTEPSREDPWADGNSAERRPEDVIYTLNSTIENIESRYGAAESEEGEGEGVRWEIIQEGSNADSRGNANGNVHHLDGQPRGVKMNLEDLVAQFKPFRAPPPPVPFPEYETAKSKQKERKTAAQASTAVAKEGDVKPKQKTFTTTITVTESTYANGRKTYTASSGPIISQAVQEQDPATATAESGAIDVAPARLTRRERVRKMRAEQAETPSSTRDAGSATEVSAVINPLRRSPIGERERRMGRTMFLISVKRQRKLKMKKHKYKKLMKRTRNLRRRLERN